MTQLTTVKQNIQIIKQPKIHEKHSQCPSGTHNLKMTWYRPITKAAVGIADTVTRGVLTSDVEKALFAMYFSRSRKILAPSSVCNLCPKQKRISHGKISLTRKKYFAQTNWWCGSVVTTSVFGWRTFNSKIAGDNSIVKDCWYNLWRLNIFSSLYYSYWKQTLKCEE